MNNCGNCVCQPVCILTDTDQMGGDVKCEHWSGDNAAVVRLEKGIEFMKKQWIRTLKCEAPTIWGGWPLDGLPVACDFCEACLANPQKEEL